MKLKLTLERAQGKPSVDLVVTADPHATVGAVADFLVAADPEGAAAEGEGHLTLVVAESPHEGIDRELGIVDAGVRNGQRVRLVAAAGGGERRAAAIAYVRAGPDAGREYPLAYGSSTIGRDDECEVRLSDPMTSRKHARIHVGDRVEITDLGSANGVVVAGAPVESAVLQAGDTVALGDTVIGVRLTDRPRGPAGTASVTFNRSPRIRSPYQGRTFSLPEPPVAAKAQRFPIIPLFAPMLMGAALYLTTRSTISLLFMAMSPLMMVGNVAEGQMAGKRTYAADLERFRSALQARRADIDAAITAEAAARRAEVAATESCVTAARTTDPLVWSRRPGDDDFGAVVLGTATMASRSKVDRVPSRQADPSLVAEAAELGERVRQVEGVPVVVDLDGGALGVAGRRSAALDAARALVVQVATLHSPAEVHLCALVAPEREADWDWLKWLPHCEWGGAADGGPSLVSGPGGCAAVLGRLEALVRVRSEGQRGDGRLPRVMVVVDDPIPAALARLLDLAARGAEAGIWVLWCGNEVADLPASCQAYLDVSGGDGVGAVGLVATGARLTGVRVEAASPSVAADTARHLSPLVDASAREAGQADVPRSVALLTLVGPELAESADLVVERWVENRSIVAGARAVPQRGKGKPANLRAVLGESASGPHVLDLKEHGPHALVGGTTGAGKSELLQSWIIAMALSNSPQRLTFLLVDYKGGSAFSDCTHLPHTVGLVTDLGPQGVRRALTSLSAELRYRERILHAKKAKDLAALEVTGDPDAPPSLVIVVDEFAALVKEVPEFVDGVVNVAQRGRSLGLHLILATQRPSGVIRDNLRANTNLRIALRMNDVTDSTDVIGTRTAAGFDPGIPGRAASRTGPTALVPFQTGYVGGWTTSLPAAPTVGAAGFGFAPAADWVRPGADEVEPAPDGPTDIKRLVTSIQQASALAELAPPRRPWLDDLARTYDLARLPTRRRDDELVFGVVDDPDNQEQSTVAFRPDDDGNMAVFGTGNSGKSTLLRSLAVAAGFTVRGGPCWVYALDFGASGLRMLDRLPHVGSVIPGADTERAARLLADLRATIDRRSEEFAAAGAGSITEYRKITGRKDEARILLLVDNMGALRSAYEGTEHHRLFDQFLSIAADGRLAGVHVVLSADRAGAIPSALGSLVQRRVVLRMAADNDYAMLGQPVDVLDAKAPPGRGIVEGLELQVAILGDSPDLLAQDVAMQDFAVAMTKAGALPAPAVRKLEAEVALEELPAEEGGRPVFAMAGETLAPLGFVTEGTFTVAGPPGSGRTTALITLVSALRRWCPESKCLYFGSRRSVLATALEWDCTAFDIDAAIEAAGAGAALLGDTADGASPGVVVIEGIVDYVQSKADAPLQAFLKEVTARGHLVVSDGEPVPLSGLPALLQTARASRVGLVLQPEQTDGSLFRSQFPRLRKADFPPGRALYVARGKQPQLVQVATVGTPPH